MLHNLVCVNMYIEYLFLGSDNMDLTKVDFGMFLDDTTEKDSSYEPPKIEFPLCYDSKTGEFNGNISFYHVISELDYIQFFRLSATIVTL